MNYLQGLQQHLEPAQHMIAQPPVALALKQPAAARDLGEGRGLRGERVLPPAERSVGAAHPDLRRREELVHHGAHVQLQGGGVDVARAADLLQRLAAVRVVLRRAGVVEHRHHWKTVGVVAAALEPVPLAAAAVAQQRRPHPRGEPTAGRERLRIVGGALDQRPEERGAPLAIRRRRALDGEVEHGDGVQHQRLGAGGGWAPQRGRGVVRGHAGRLEGDPLLPPLRARVEALAAPAVGAG